MRSPLLIFHICGGIVGLLSGAVAMSFRKGSKRHAIAGNIFVAAMMGMASAGVLLAGMKAQPGNILGGLVTCYLVATAWRTVRRREGAPGMFDWGALLVVVALCAVEITFGTQAALSPTGLRYDYPPGPYYFLGSIALLAVIGDVRVIVHRGISGTQRLARHLWRMCFALFIASSSVFLARQHLFPVWIRKSGLLMLLSFLPLLLMFFWLIRVRFASSVKQKLLIHVHA
jgi:hypothetical protein